MSLIVRYDYTTFGITHKTVSGTADDASVDVPEPDDGGGGGDPGE